MLFNEPWTIMFILLLIAYTPIILLTGLSTWESFDRTMNEGGIVGLLVGFSMGLVLFAPCFYAGYNAYYNKK